MKQPLPTETLVWVNPKDFNLEINLTVVQTVVS